MLLDRERRQGEVETGEKRKRRNREEQTEESTGLEGIAVLIGPCHIAWRAPRGLAIVGVVTVVFGAEGLEKTVVGKTRMQGRSWMCEAVRDLMRGKENKLTTLPYQGNAGGFWGFWRGWETGGSSSTV